LPQSPKVHHFLTVLAAFPLCPPDYQAFTKTTPNNGQVFYRNRWLSTLAPCHPSRPSQSGRGSSGFDVEPSEMRLSPVALRKLASLNRAVATGVANRNSGLCCSAFCI
jgi:hypothetical protein